jgi:hypothetical protein
MENLTEVPLALYSAVLIIAPEGDVTVQASCGETPFSFPCHGNKRQRTRLERSANRAFPLGPRRS